MNVMASLCLSPSSCSSYLGAEDVWVGLFSECVVGSQVKLVIKSSRELGFGGGGGGGGGVCEKKGPALLFGYLSFQGSYCASLQQPPSTTTPAPASCHLLQ